MRLSKTRSLVFTGVLLILGFWLGRACSSRAVSAPDSGSVSTAAENEVWTCSMHPQIRLPEPGNCPICFMELVLTAAGGDEEGLDPRMLRMSANAIALAGIETAAVERRSVTHEVSMVGKIAFDETRLAYITSWVSGRLDRLFVDYTGVTVRAGDHLVEIYSPTLYTAQQELLQAIATAKRLEGSSLDIVRSTSDQMVISSREKLRLYGLSPDQIQAIVERGVPDEHVTIRAPIGGVVVHKNALEGMYVEEGTRIYTIADLSKVWVLLDAYESDLAWLRYGQDVEFHVAAFPGEMFHGRIAFIDPLLNDRTRTIKIRLNVDNSDQRLKPDMFVSATTHAVLTAHGKVVDKELAGRWMCPMHPEVVADGPGQCPECGMDLVPASELGFVAQPEGGESLVIPHTAPLITGKRAVVYVRLPDVEQPTFEGREIVLGPRAGDWYVVREGLREGEQVVVKGNFKLDSELQIRARPSMMSPEGGAPPPAHDHGAMPSQGGGASVPTELEDVATQGAFRAQLGDVVDAYLRSQHAFTLDEDSQAMAQSIVDALAAVDMSLLKGAAHVAWMEQLPDLRQAAEDFAASEDLARRRALLGPLTDRLVRALKTFGYERGGGQVGVFHCPMADDGAGADWIQEGAETVNPYYGSEMLRCGSLTEVLREGH